jgi:glycosyltransferase involved in cell wall biosynthesis
VSAFNRVIEELNNAVLVIAGPDDGYLSKLQSLINTLGLNDNVLLVGPLYGKDKLAAYVDANVYVLPSTYETFPVTILEAYACSKPVIASQIGCLSDLVIDDITGYLVEVRSPDKLANAIVKLLRDPKKTEEMGLNGRKLVQTHYNTEKVVDILENIYRMIG